MKRTVAIALLLLASASAAAPPEEPETGPAMLVVPCVLGPHNLPIVAPEPIA